MCVEEEFQTRFVNEMPRIRSRKHIAETVEDASRDKISAYNKERSKIGPFLAEMTPERLKGTFGCHTRVR